MKRSWSWRSILFEIHLVGGLLAAFFLLVLAGTGCIMAFEPDIDRLLHPSLFRVTPSGEALPLSVLAAKVAAVMRSDERIGIYILPGKPDNPCVFTLFASGRRPRQVFADEYSGRILGSLSVVRFVLVAHAIHESGDAVMGCAAILLMSSLGFSAGGVVERELALRFSSVMWTVASCSSSDRRAGRRGLGADRWRSGLGGRARC